MPQTSDSRRVFVAHFDASVVIVAVLFVWCELSLKKKIECIKMETD